MQCSSWPRAGEAVTRFVELPALVPKTPRSGMSSTAHHHPATSMVPGPCNQNPIESLCIQGQWPRRARSCSDEEKKQLLKSEAELSRTEMQTQPFRTQSVLRKRLQPMRKAQTEEMRTHVTLGRWRCNQSTRFLVAEVIGRHFVHLLALSLKQSEARFVTLVGGTLLLWRSIRRGLRPQEHLT